MPREIEINKVPILIYPDHETASRAIAQMIVDGSSESKDPYTLNLSGGETILRAEELLTRDPDYRDKIDWMRIHLCLGNEHWLLPGGSNTTNFEGAWQHFKILVKAGKLPRQNIHNIFFPINEEDLLDLGLIQAEAKRWEEEIARLMEDLYRASDIEFDLSIIGLGGGKPGNPRYAHFAGILSEKEGCPIEFWDEDSDKITIGILYPPGTPKSRGMINLMPDVFKDSYQTVMFVTGEGKAEALKDVLTCDIARIRELPGAIIRQCNNGIVITDEACAKLL